MKPIPSSAGFSHHDAPADVYEQEVRTLMEIGWTDAARAAALASRRAKTRPASPVTALARAVQSGGGSGVDLGSRKGADKIRDRVIRDLVNTYGPEAGNQIKTNLSIRLGVKSKTATSIRSSFFSNDGRHMYSGSVRGMRQKIMSWAKKNKKMLPANFENRPPSAITGMFRGMARGGYFSGGKSRKRAYGIESNTEVGIR